MTRSATVCSLVVDQVTAQASRTDNREDMMRTHTVIDSPIGALTLVATDGALSGLYMEEHLHMPDRSSFGPRVGCGFEEAAEQLGEYFAGRRDRIRAVGAANGRNPLAIVVPCHRVVGGDGSLTGYAGGLARKRALLDLERPSAHDRGQLF
jgi:methylated-DNA-[protein]-cysteine S-methyltransferase